MQEKEASRTKENLRLHVWFFFSGQGWTVSERPGLQLAGDFRPSFSIGGMDLLCSMWLMHPLWFDLERKIRLQLDYCRALYVKLPLKMIWKLKRVPNVAIRVSTGLWYRQHIMPFWKQLNWLPVCFLAQFKVLDLAKWPGKDCLLKHVSALQLQSSSEGLLPFPSVIRWDGLLLEAGPLQAWHPNFWMTSPQPPILVLDLMIFQLSLAFCWTCFYGCNWFFAWRRRKQSSGCPRTHRRRTGDHFTGRFDPFLLFADHLGKEYPTWEAGEREGRQKAVALCFQSLLHHYPPHLHLYHPAWYILKVCPFFHCFCYYYLRSVLCVFRYDSRAWHPPAPS